MTQPTPIRTTTSFQVGGAQLVGIGYDHGVGFAVINGVPGHVIVPVAEYEQLTAVDEAARAYVASEATRHDLDIPNGVWGWVAANRAALDALTAAVDALDAGDHSAVPDQHEYLSTGCLHGEHNYCASGLIVGVRKAPAQCKFCSAPCVCSCHGAEATDG